MISNAGKNSALRRWYCRVGARQLSKLPKILASWNQPFGGATIENQRHETLAATWAGRKPRGEAFRLL
jgi:hypothetical protein